MLFFLCLHYCQYEFKLLHWCLQQFFLLSYVFEPNNEVIWLSEKQIQIKGLCRTCVINRQIFFKPGISQYASNEAYDNHCSSRPGICTRDFDRNCFCVATEVKCISAAHCHRHEEHLNRNSQSRIKLSREIILIYSSIAVYLMSGNAITLFICCCLFVTLTAAKSISFYVT